MGRYQTEKGLNPFLTSLELKAKKIQQQCIETGTVGQILMSDRAKQFASFDHAACLDPYGKTIAKNYLHKPKNRRPTQSGSKCLLDNL